MKDEYYTWTLPSLTTLLGLAAGTIIQNGLLIGVALALSYLLYKKSVKVARINGKTERSKILHALTGELIEITGITAAFFLTEAWPVVFALAAVGFREAFLNQVKTKLELNTSEILGRNERIVVIVITYLSSYLNEYTLVYGLLLIGSMALIETGRQIFLFFKT